MKTTADLPVRRCKVCGGPIAIGRQLAHQYRRRQYCSHRCTAKMQQDKADGNAELEIPEAEVWRRAAEIRANRTSRTPEDAPEPPVEARTYRLVNSQGGAMFLSVLFVIASMASGQERSVLEVLEHGQPIGRATVVAKEPVAEGAAGSVGHAITANHVVEDFPLTVGGKFQSFRCRFRSGREVKDCWTIRRDESVDLALIVVWVPADVEPVPLLDCDVPEAESLTRDWVVRRSRFCVTNGGYRYFDAAIESGESGGPVFRDGCLVGVVSGGWFWMQRDCTECPGLTWPMRAANADRIRLLMEGGDQ